MAKTNEFPKLPQPPQALPVTLIPLLLVPLPKPPRHVSAATSTIFRESVFGKA